jgi:hypothetical protein
MMMPSEDTYSFPVEVQPGHGLSIVGVIFLVGLMQTLKPGASMAFSLLEIGDDQ